MSKMLLLESLALRQHLWIDRLSSHQLTAAQQAKTVFGNADKVFSSLFDKFSAIFSGGPNQMGFSQNELNALNAGVTTNAAISARNAMTAVKGAQSAFGGGNTSNPSGARIGAEMNVANAAAASKATALNEVSLKNWETGRDNFWKAGEGLMKSPSVYDNVPEMTNAATKSNANAMSNAQAVNSANNWWVAPVEGLIGAGVNMATGGLTGMMGAGSAASGAAAATHDAQGAAEDAASFGGGSGAGWMANN